MYCLFAALAWRCRAPYAWHQALGGPNFAPVCPFHVTHAGACQRHQQRPLACTPCSFGLSGGGEGMCGGLAGGWVIMCLSAIGPGGGSGGAEWASRAVHVLHGRAFGRAPGSPRIGRTNGSLYNLLFTPQVVCFVWSWWWMTSFIMLMSASPPGNRARQPFDAGGGRVHVYTDSMLMRRRARSRQCPRRVGNTWRQHPLSLPAG